MKLGLPSTPRDDTFAARIAWITALRLAFLVFMLGAIAILYLGGELAQFPFSLRIVFLTIGVGFFLAIGYAIGLRSGARLDVLAWTQVVVDQLTATAIVYVSGGVSSGATSLYALTCLVGAVLVGVRGAFGAGAIGVTLYATLSAGLHFGWILPPPDQVATGYIHDAAHLTYPLIVNTLGVSVVAFLSGYLAERLRLTGGELQMATARVLEAENLAALGRVAAGLAHEIRNPLGSITGSIEMLRESPSLSEEDRRLCDIVYREAKRLNDLVGDMVDLSRPRPPTPAPTDVAALAREVVSLATHAARGSDVAVKYEGTPKEAVAWCDGAQMRQVLWNLVRNAIQASAGGKIVFVRITVDERHVRLTVDDEGEGVPEGARIFDEFFTTRTHGAGIGLAVVRRIIEGHASVGATVNVERSSRGGASFQIALHRKMPSVRGTLRPGALA